MKKHTPSLRQQMPLTILLCWLLPMAIAATADIFSFLWSCTDPFTQNFFRNQAKETNKPLRRGNVAIYGCNCGFVMPAH